MGQKPSRPSVKLITQDVSEIRRSIRRDKEKIDDAAKQQIQGLLVNYSQQVNSMASRSKRKDVEAAQKLISEVSSELLADNVGKSEDSLDMAAIETNSFIHISNKNGDKDTKQSPRRKKEITTTAQRLSSVTLNDVESKFDSIKLDAKVAIANGDKNRLHFLSKSIENLATNLELIPAEEHLVLQERKDLLERKLAKLYNRINTAKKQIARNDNIGYLTELHDKHKDASLGQLNDIQQALMDIDVASLPTNDLTRFESLRDEVNDYGKQVDAIDESSGDALTKKNQISGLIANLLGSIDSAASKAKTEMLIEEKLGQAEESHERFKSEVNHFSKPRHSQDYSNYRKYLEQLKDYVTKIPEINPNVEQRKKLYLIDVENSLDILEQKAHTSEPPNPEAEVVLRDKRNQSQQSLINSRTIDGLYIYWKELEDNIVLDSLSQEELWTMYNMFNTLIVSINEKNREINAAIKRNQNQQSDQSQSNDDLVKVTVKISSPVTTAEHVGNSKQRIRSKDSVRKIDDITKEVAIIKNQIDGSFSNEDYQLMKAALESHRRSVNKLSIYKNENVRNSAYDLRKSIDKALSRLSEKKVVQESIQSNGHNRKSATEDVLSEIMSLGTKVNDLSDKCKAFSTITHDDYEQIKTELTQYEHYLQTMNLTSYTANIGKARDDVLEQVVISMTHLEDMVKIDDSDEKQFRQELQNLKDKVSRFTGAYKNVLYKKIEEDLHGCLLNVSSKVKNPAKVVALREDIEKHLKILEEKSVKDGQYDGSLTRKAAKVPPPIMPKPSRTESISTKLSKIRQDVERVVLEMNESSPKTKEEYAALDGRLTLSILALDNLTIVKNKQFSDERNKLYEEIHRQLSYISDKISLIDYPAGRLMPQTYNNNNNNTKSKTAELDQIDSDIDKIRSEVLIFVGSEESDKFVELDEAITQYTFQLKNLKVDKSSPLYDQKVKMFIELQDLSDILERRLRESEKIEQIERDITDVIIKTDSFVGYFQDADYNDLDEQLINLNVKINRLMVNDQLAARKNKCIQDIGDCLKRLNQVARKKDIVGEGTLV